MPVRQPCLTASLGGEGIGAAAAKAPFPTVEGTLHWLTA
jgi:hypothetical protein